MGGVLTIGIAAVGPNAGRAIIRALAAVESLGRGAIGGFVNLVAITAAGTVERAEIQRGGSAALFSGGIASMPIDIAEARIACLMSSGPDRPEPLSQFTPADARVGLVTGHRMPNTIGVNGVNLNDEVLDLMRRGLSPTDAVERDVNSNPEVDAGIIAVDVSGRIYAANTRLVERRNDRGSALCGSPGTGAVAAVLHNAIRPHRPIAALAAEIAMDVMQPDDRPDGWITFRKGIPLIQGRANAVDVNADGAVEAILVENPKFLDGQWSLGIGYETMVLSRAEVIASMLYEPYMIVDDGILRKIDGQAELSVPIRSR